MYSFGINSFFVKNFASRGRSATRSISFCFGRSFSFLFLRGFSFRLVFFLGIPTSFWFGSAGVNRSNHLAYFYGFTFFYRNGNNTSFFSRHGKGSFVRIKFYNFLIFFYVVAILY